MDHGTVRWAELSTGVRLPYVSVGPESAAPAVVLLHAWGESRRCFDRLIPMLAGTVRVVAIDMRGHGEADRPNTGYSLAALGEDVVAFMDAVGLSSVVLLGSSSGGYIAQQVAAFSPHRVCGLVLVGSPRSLQGRASFADEVDTRGEEDELARAIPKSQMVTYKDTGHLVLWEQPHRIAADVTHFLEKLPQSSH